MFFNRLNLYYNTLKHVKPTQLYHQVYYRLKNRFFTSTYHEEPSTVAQLKLFEGIPYQDSWLGNNRFSFLNLEKDFKEPIDWNYSAYGKLWTYNLNYFEFLNQGSITKQEGLRLIQDYLSKREHLKDGFEPYPISLRGINWIKFLSREKINDPGINKILYQDYLRLADNLEYHLLANHLLENGFSLLFGAYFFHDEEIYKKAKRILISELKEQILADGAHFELSPMYHQIILHRLLNSYDLVKNNPWKDQELLPLLQEKAKKMLGWLNNISFRSGEIPKLNDAADGVAPTTVQLLLYAKKLKIEMEKEKLGDSGYRKFFFGDFECVLDVGQIAPSYQPGHSHADNLNFVINFKDSPIIVDTGISTYEKNARRQLERSTASHNTVTINELNSSEVWSGFRVGRRAKTQIIRETPDEIIASHNGYRNIGIRHKRTFTKGKFEFDVSDELESVDFHGIPEGQGTLHFHPDVTVMLKGDEVILNGSLKMKLYNIRNIQIENYQFAAGYNKLIEAKKITYLFEKEASLSLCPIT